MQRASSTCSPAQRGYLQLGSSAALRRLGFLRGWGVEVQAGEGQEKWLKCRVDRPV